MAIIKRSMGKITSIVDIKKVDIDDDETREAVKKAGKHLKPKKISVKEFLEK